MSTTQAPRVLIVGSGALGVVAAYTLQEYGHADVTLVVKFDYDIICKDGFGFKSVQFGEFSGWKPKTMIQDTKDCGTNYDYIIVALKNLPDGPEPVEDIIRPAIEKSPEAAVILFENGIDIEKPLIEAFPGHTLISGVSLINCSNINRVVNQRNKDGIILGVFDNPTLEDMSVAKAKLHTFAKLYYIEGMNTVTEDENVRLSRWKKLVYNAAINSTTALVELDVTRCTICGFKENLCRPIIKEIYAIAKADGYIIPPETEEQMLSLSNGLYYKPSMCVDVDLHRMIEVETIVGNPLRIAKRNNVPAPHLETIYHLLRMVQFRTMESNGLVKLDLKNGVAVKNF